MSVPRSPRVAPRCRVVQPLEYRATRGLCVREKRRVDVRSAPRVDAKRLARPIPPRETASGGALRPSRRCNGTVLRPITMSPDLDPSSRIAPCLRSSIPLPNARTIEDTVEVHGQDLAPFLVRIFSAVLRDRNTGHCSRALTRPWRRSSSARHDRRSREGKLRPAAPLCAFRGSRSRRPTLRRRAWVGSRMATRRPPRPAPERSSPPIPATPGHGRTFPQGKLVEHHLRTPGLEVLRAGSLPGPGGEGKK